MTEDSNIEILKEAYNHWNENKEQAFDHWMALFADDVHFKSLANGHEGMEFTRTCHCKKDVLRYFEELAGDWEMIHYTVDEFIAQGDRVVAIGNCHWRYMHTGKEVETAKVDIITMKDSKITDFFELYDTKSALDCTV